MSTNVPTIISTVAEDVQAAGSDTRPPMLDRTDYDSWAQRIRLYCLGKENGVNILKSIDEGPYRVETTRDVLDTAEDGTLIYGMDRPKMYDELDDKEKKRFDADIQLPTLYCKVYQRTSTSLSITTPRQKLYGIMSRCFFLGLS